jgi:large subunit ribosomal protein L29
MTIEEIREMSERDLRQALEDNKLELFNLRFQLATRKTKNHQRIPVVKRDIARIQTILRERELMAEYAGLDLEELSEGGTATAASTSLSSARGTAKRGGLLSRVRRSR